MLDKALTLIIPSGATRDMNKSDVKNLLDTYALTEVARDDFLAQRINFQEYIDLLETAQVNIDGYLESLECNLATFNLM